MKQDKADRIKEIVEKMQKRTPQKSKNPSLVQKEIKKELKKEEVLKEKKEESKKEAGKTKGPGVPDGTGPFSETEDCQLKNKITFIIKKVKAILNSK